METRAIQFDGLAAIELVHAGAAMVIVHELGPRIAYFGRAEHDDNLLFWDRDHRHRRGPWSLRGGHRLWVWRPGADESEESYEPDDARCRVEPLADRGVRVSAPPERNRIEKSLEVTVGGDGWTISHRLRNTGDMLWAGGAWGLTCTLPRGETRYRIPLDGGHPAWDMLTVVIPRRWGGSHTSSVSDAQFAMTEAAIEIAPSGTESKRMVYAPRGTIEMRDPQRGTFTKTAAVVPGGSYPLATNLAVYLGPDAFMAELETMSPLRTLLPGETLIHDEHWRLAAG